MGDGTCDPAIDAAWVKTKPSVSIWDLNGMDIWNKWYMPTQPMHNGLGSANYEQKQREAWKT